MPKPSRPMAQIASIPANTGRLLRSLSKTLLIHFTFMIPLISCMPGWVFTKLSTPLLCTALCIEIYLGTTPASFVHNKIPLSLFQLLTLISPASSRAPLLGRLTRQARWLSSQLKSFLALAAELSNTKNCTRMNLHFGLVFWQL